MRKSKNNHPDGTQKKGLSHVHTVSPSPKVYGRKDPEALKRQISTNNQRDGFEEIIRYGEDNALPLKIAQAVSESPAASSCIDTVAQFIKGAGFSNPELMTHPIDKDGTTLWDFHCQLSDCIALFRGFAVNFKFNQKGRIINSYYMNFESCRFKAPGDKTPYITHIKFNPYFGTSEYQMQYSQEYPVFDIQQVKNQINALDPSQKDKWGGQVYYWSKTSPIHRFYPVPNYWSAKEAIQADHKLQEFNNEELDNGFFQSVLINAIGDPNRWSNNPRSQKEEQQSDGTIKKVPTKTVGEEFNEEMSATFSGSKKAGTAMVLWSANTSDQAIKIQSFPTGINGDRLTSTQDSITKTITIATQVPSILANISEGVSLGSGGSEIQKAIELMQSRTEEFRRTLEHFYNKILLPNLENKIEGEVKIQLFTPISEPVEIEDKFWEFMNEDEKIAFIRKNMPHIEIIRTPTTTITTPVQPTTTSGETVETQTGVIETKSDPKQDELDQLIRGLSRKDLSKFWGYVKDYQNGRATLEQTKVFLRAYKLSDEQIMLFLNDPEGDGV